MRKGEWMWNVFYGSVCSVSSKGGGGERERERQCVCVCARLCVTVCVAQIFLLQSPVSSNDVMLWHNERKKWKRWEERWHVFLGSLHTAVRIIIYTLPLWAHAHIPPPSQPSAECVCVCVWCWSIKLKAVVFTECLWFMHATVWRLFPSGWHPVLFFFPLVDCVLLHLFCLT